MDRLANARPGKRDRDLWQPFQPSCRTNRKMNLLHSRLRQTSIDPIGGQTRHQHMRPGMELCLNRHMIATDQTTGWIHEPGVGTPAVVEIRRRKVMPGTRARRAREYRARARSLELIGQPPTPADCFKHRRTGRRKVHRRPFSNRLRKNSVLHNTPLEPYSADTRIVGGCSKRPDFSLAQPWRLLHPPARSLPRQPLRPGARLIPCKAAANYHLIKGWLG